MDQDIVSLSISPVVPGLIIPHVSRINHANHPTSLIWVRRVDNAGMVDLGSLYR